MRTFFQKCSFLYACRIVGRNIAILGIKETSRSVIKSAITYGTIFLLISFSVILLILQATYRFTPTGGVICPIAIFMLMITPNAV